MESKTSPVAPSSFLKIAVLGPHGTGKSSLVNGIVQPQEQSTIDFDENEECRTIELHVDGQDVLMEIWDFPGDEYMGAMKEIIAMSSESFDAVMFVLDFTSTSCQRDELSLLLDQLNALHRISLERKFCLLVVGNKYDLVNTTLWSQSSERSVRSWCSTHQTTFVRTKCVPPGEESHIIVFSEVVRSYIQSFISLPSLLMRSVYIASDLSSHHTSLHSSRLRQDEWRADDADTEDASGDDRVEQSELFPKSLAESLDREKEDDITGQDEDNEEDGYDGEADEVAVELKQKSFDFQELIPKDATRLRDFLQLHPTFDGRGCVVAIFDTGVDPGASLLQTTTEGKPKILDVIDCTGDGDVNMRCTRVVNWDTDASEDGRYRIEGASGRILTLGTSEVWKEALGGVFHVGVKAVYQLYPEPLVNRLRDKCKKSFLEKQNALLSSLLDKIACLDADDSATARRSKKDLEKQVVYLETFMKNYTDLGPQFDVVAFQDKFSEWQIVVDVDQAGDLNACEIMHDFSESHEFGTFQASEDAFMNFCVHVFEDGDLVSIVTDCSPHGTHVAGIVAGHDPSDSARDGIAPGAQLLSCKIGDVRVSGMETMTSLMRAVNVVVTHHLTHDHPRCEFVNLSFGEDSRLPNSGRFADFAREMIKKHNIFFFSSAGNEGPALSTAGSPGGTTEEMFGVGAYVSKTMMETQYSLLDASKIPEEGLSYTWSSRGPTRDGSNGVDICAPGAAIAPVSNWTLSKMRLMNGTSMSSPNACGCIACLVSGLKQKNIPYTPWSVKRALSDTCILSGNDPCERLSKGAGLLQIPEAFDHLCAFSSEENPHILYHVSVDGSFGKNFRGISIREKSHLGQNGRTSAHVTVMPLVAREDDGKRDVLELEDVCELHATTSWITCPQHIHLVGSGRSFEVSIDTSALDVGMVHCGEIIAYSTADCSHSHHQRSLFKVPVTVIVPEEIAYPFTFSFEQDLSESSISRRFFSVPQGISHARLQITCDPVDKSRLVYVDALQCIPDLRRNDSELSKRHWFSSKPSMFEEVFAVHDNYTMELCIAQHWGHVGKTKLHVTMEFFGFGVVGLSSSVPLSFHQATRIDGCVIRGSEKKLPVTAKLDTISQFLMPTKYDIKIVRAGRDSFPQGKRPLILTLHYEFHLKVKKPTDVTMWIAVAEDMLYESCVEGPLISICDQNKRIMSQQDCYRKKVTLTPGKYHILAQFRHDDRTVLKEMSELVLSVYQTIPDILVPLCTSRSDILCRKTAKIDLCLERSSPFFFYACAPFDLTKQRETFSQLSAIWALEGVLKIGDFAIAPLSLTGHLSFVGTGPKKPKWDEKTPSMHLPIPTETMKKLSFDKFSEFLRNDIDRLDGDFSLKYELARLAVESKQPIETSLSLLDAAIESVNLMELLMTCSLRLDDTDDEEDEAKKKSEAEKLKAQYIKLLLMKAHVLDGCDHRKEEFVAAVHSLRKTTDLRMGNDFLLHVHERRISECPGDALACLQGHRSLKGCTKELLDEEIAILKQLGWLHILNHLENVRILSFPSDWPTI